jgi:hypothetical protein
MLKLVAILVLSGQLAVAVETDSGFVERSFPNTASGAEQLMEYAVVTVGEPENGIHIVVGWLRDEDNDEHIIAKLAEHDIKHGLASPEDIRGAAVENKLPENSPTAVALAFKKRFAFLWSKRPR